MSFKRTWLWIAAVIGALLLSAVSIVPAGRFAVRESQGGTAAPLGPGLHLRLPLYQRVYVYDSAVENVHDDGGSEEVDFVVGTGAVEHNFRSAKFVAAVSESHLAGEFG